MARPMFVSAAVADNVVPDFCKWMHGAAIPRAVNAICAQRRWQRRLSSPGQ